MPISEATSCVVRFGGFEPDLRSAELRKAGLMITLQEQPFRILTFLLEHPGEVVTREALRQRLWPSGVFVNFDDSINSAIKKLRQPWMTRLRSLGSFEGNPGPNGRQGSSRRATSLSSEKRTRLS